MSGRLYRIQRIPDLTLSKYSALDENGVEGVLAKHLVFLRQLHRHALLTDETIHWIYEYDPKAEKGKRLKIFLKFDSSQSSDYADTFIKKSPLAPYFDIVPADEKISFNLEHKYDYMAVLIKREKIARADRAENGFFYSVNKWEMNEDARLFNLFSMMNNMDQPCVYCVDVKAADLTSRIEDPEILGNVMFALRGMLALRVEHSSMVTALQKDETADYTLSRYKDLIEDISANPHFLANIRAYTNDAEYAGMLLDAAASEALAEGAHDIVFNQGTFDAARIINSEVSPFCDSNAPQELTFLPTLFILKELSPFVVFPALYPGESIGLPKETAPSYNSSGLYLGRDDDDFEVFIPLENLSKHAFLSGVPGSGKTNSILHIVTELYKKNIPFLVLEPAKQEYRALVNRDDMKGITIFSPSSGTKFLLHINPFEFPVKMSLAEHIRNLINVFDGAFSMDPPMPFLLDQAIEQVYRDKGWLPYMINDGTVAYPTMEELYDALEKILERTDYEGEVKGNLKSILQVRIGSLLSREMGDIFNVPSSTIAPEDWLKRSVVIELESMGSGPANFLTLMLSTLIRESLKVNPMTREEKKKTPVRHVIVFEEAHNLIGAQTEKVNSQTANPKVAATAFVVKMLSEVRALNEAIIIADQLPTAMAPEVIKNTSLKIGHRMTSMDDRELLGSTMSADAVQMERMATFSQGKALAIYEGLLKPFEMQLHQWSRIGDKVDDNLYTSPDDDELYEILSYEGSPFLADMNKSFEITRKKFESQWSELFEEIGDFYDNLDDVKIFREEIARIESILNDEAIDKASRARLAKALEEARKKEDSASLDSLVQYDYLCDKAEEIIFALSSYKKQNLIHSQQIEKLLSEKIQQYTTFLVDAKERFDLERSDAQKQRRNKLLQQLK